MRKIRTMKVTFGFIFLSFIFCGISLLTGTKETQAGLTSFDFTYTSSDTTDTVLTLGGIKTFSSTLTNTGTEADSYIVTMIKNQPIPPQWIIDFCSGGVCHPPSVFKDTVYLSAGEHDNPYVEITPLSCCGDAKITMRVTSIKSPGLSKSINFFLHADCEPSCVPTTNHWGLLILITLLCASGFYLIWKKSKLATATRGS